MVRSDKACSGVIFSIDTESGFKDAILITGSYGLGEMVVQGAVNPDEFYVYKPAIKHNKKAILKRTLGKKALQMIYSDNPEQRVCKVEVRAELQNQFCLTESEIIQLAKEAILIENHYGCPMDIEWAKDGLDGQLYIVQARPETVQSRVTTQTIERYILKEKSTIVCEGRSIGQKNRKGKARVLKDISEMAKVQPGDVLVTDMTDPDWEPIMKRASAIITNRGGVRVMPPLSHAN